MYENAVTVAAGDPITAPAAELDKSVFGGDTTFSTGTTVKFSSDLNVDYNYDTKALTVTTVDGKNSSNLQTQNALFTGIKDAYSMVKFTVVNHGGTEKDPGMGVRYVDESGKKFQYLTRQNGVRIGEPKWISWVDSFTDKSIDLTKNTSYDLMFVRANDLYYIFAKLSTASDYALMYVSTPLKREAQGAMTANMPSGEARVSLTFTIGNNINVNYTFTNFGSAQGEAAVKALVPDQAITVGENEHATVTVIGEKVVKDATGYTVPYGANVTVKAAAAEGHEVTSVKVNGTAIAADSQLTNVIEAKEITVETAALEATVAVTGTLTASIVPTGMDGAGNTYVAFTRDNGKTYMGKVTVGEGNAMTYAAQLPAGTYTQVNWMGNMSDTEIVVTDAGEQNLTLDKVGYTAVTSTGLTVGDDASLTTKKNESGTHETAMTGVTFNPAKQKLTFSYTLTGMNTKTASVGHYAMPGMFVMDKYGNVMRIALVEAGDQLMLMAKDDYNSRMFFQHPEPWKPFGAPTGYYTFDKENYKLTMKIVVDGHKIEMYAKIANETNWRTVYGADSQYDVEARYMNNTCQLGGAGSSYVDTLYGANEDCRFGISMRRDSANDDLNVAKFSNIWYTIEDRA